MVGSYCIFHIWHAKHMFTASPLTLWLECNLIKWPDSPINLTSKVGKTDSPLIWIHQANVWWLFLVVFPSDVMEDKRLHLATQGQPYMLACKSRWPCLRDNRLPLSHPDSTTGSDNLFPWLNWFFSYWDLPCGKFSRSVWQSTYGKPHIFDRFVLTHLTYPCFI